MADAANPMGRLGDPDTDIAPVAVFLASEDSRYLTGNTLFVDGGLAHQRLTLGAGAARRLTDSLKISELVILFVGVTAFGLSLESCPPRQRPSSCWLRILTSWARSSCGRPASLGSDRSWIGGRGRPGSSGRWTAWRRTRPIPAKDTGRSGGARAEAGAGQAKRKRRRPRSSMICPRPRTRSRTGRSARPMPMRWPTPGRRPTPRPGPRWRSRKPSCWRLGSGRRRVQFRERVARFVKQHSADDGRSEWEHKKAARAARFWPDKDGMTRVHGAVDPESRVRPSSSTFDSGRRTSCGAATTRTTPPTSRAARWRVINEQRNAEALDRDLPPRRPGRRAGHATTTRPSSSSPTTTCSAAERRRDRRDPGRRHPGPRLGRPADGLRRRDHPHGPRRQLGARSTRAGPSATPRTGSASGCGPSGTPAPSPTAPSPSTGPRSTTRTPSTTTATTADRPRQPRPRPATTATTSPTPPAGPSRSSNDGSVITTPPTAGPGTEPQRTGRPTPTSRAAPGGGHPTRAPAPPPPSSPKPPELVAPASREGRHRGSRARGLV